MTPISPFLKGKTPDAPFMKRKLGGILKWLNGYEISDFRFSNPESE
jgi:hypothetical protein